MTYPHQDSDAYDDWDPDLPSKSQLKRDMEALQQLGEQLVKLPEKQLRSTPLPDSLRDSVYKARSITAHEGLRRQLQFIGKRMRALTDEELAPIRQSLLDFQRGSKESRDQQKRLEAWRERLLKEGVPAIEFLHQSHPHLDVDELLTLVRQVQKEQLEGAPPKAYRLLYQFLKQLFDAQLNG